MRRCLWQYNADARACRGLSLIELMVGLMILVLLTGIALPSMSTLWRRYNLRTAAEELVYAAELCRGRARANRRAGVLARAFSRARVLARASLRAPTAAQGPQWRP